MLTVNVRNPLHFRGVSAFHKHPNYPENTEINLEAPFLPTPSFSWSTTWKVTRLAKKLFAIIVFPVVLYYLFHAFIGKNFVVRAASIPKSTTSQEIDRLRVNGFLMNDGFLYKRFSINVNGEKIDAMLIGTKESLEASNTWFIHANGQGSLYEQELTGCVDFKRHITNLNANGVIFNYKGVGRSEGSVSKEAVIESTQAVIDLIINKEKGFGAKKVYIWGHSLGGAIILQALERLLDQIRSRNDLAIVAIVSRSFSKFSLAISEFFNSKLIGLLSRISGWELDSFEASKKLDKVKQIKQIILQTTLPQADNYTPTTNPHETIFDGMITSKSSLTTELLRHLCKRRRLFVSMNEPHNTPLYDIEKLDKLLIQHTPAVG